ncbi:MAG: alpha/beta fold hydrolase [Pseudomonadales bacterium]
MSIPRRVKTAGLTVNSRIEGSGPPLLYLGGSNFDLSIKATVFDSDLTKHFTVAAFDPRGLGRTDSPEGDWTMQDYAQDALHVLDAMSWDNVSVLGESFGAMVALHLAVLAPQRINRLALAACSPGGAGGSSYPIETFLGIADPLERASAQLNVLDTRFIALLKKDPNEAALRVQTRANKDAKFMASHNNRNGYPRLLQARAQHDCWTHLPQLTAPTLIFAGRHDNQAPIDRAQSMVQAIPNATLHIIDGCHGHCFLSPQPVAKIIERWATETLELAL